MNYLPFKWEGPASLADELCKPLDRVSYWIEHPAWGGPTSVVLWRTDGSGLTVSSKMHDIAPRCEIGVLNFTRGRFSTEDTKVINLESTFHGNITASKLVINESGTSAESGIILEAGGKELIVVAGGFPFTLAVSGLNIEALDFQPEYPLDSYVRIPLI